VRSLTFAGALVVAEAVTGIDSVTLARASRLELLDSALHAPQAGFGEEDSYHPWPRPCRATLRRSTRSQQPLSRRRSTSARARSYPSIEQKAAVLAVRIARNHPLPDGNKRLAWQSLTVFLSLNRLTLVASVDDAVPLMLGIAAGEIDEDAARAWIRERVEPSG